MHGRNVKSKGFIIVFLNPETVLPKTIVVSTVLLGSEGVYHISESFRLQTFPSSTL